MRKETLTKQLLNIAMIAIVAVSFAPSAIAQDSESFEKQNEIVPINKKLGFFEQDSVVALDKPLEMTEQQEIQFGPSKGFKFPEYPEEMDPKKLKEHQEAKEEFSVQEEEIPEGVDKQEYVLRKEFGDPSEPVPVKGVETAPKPYKAMLKAIDMGRDDLALQYANQWMGYMKSLERVTNKASAMAGLVKAEPMAAIDGEAYTNIDPKAIADYVEKRKLDQNREEIREVNIDLGTKDKIDVLFNDGVTSSSAIKKSDGKDDLSSLTDINIPSEIRRQMIRAKLASKLPLDPNGQIKILFFLKPSEIQSMNVARELTRTVSSPELGVPLSVVPLSLEGVGGDTNKKFFDQTGMPAVIRDGVAISKTFGISEIPTLMFTTERSSKAFLKVGFSDQVFIEEVVRMMGGK